MTSVHDVVDALLMLAHTESWPGAQARAGYMLGGHDVPWATLYDQVTAAVRSARGRGPRRSVALTVPTALLTGVGHAAAYWGRWTSRTPLVTPDKIALGTHPFWVSSGDRLRRDAGWVPRVHLEEGLAETARWYVRQGWLPA